MTAPASQAPASKASAAPSTPPMTRREFLYYIWAASMAILTAQAGGATVWFALPRFKVGEFGGDFPLNLSDVPAADDGPVAFDTGRFWLVNQGDGNVTDTRLPGLAAGQPVYPQTKGVKALYKVCVHLGCLYKWVPTNNRFECPCHGSKYLPTGVRIEGPATRNLDVFVIQALDSNGKVIAETGPDGAAIDVTGAAKLIVKTGKRYNGDVNTKAGGGK